MLIEGDSQAAASLTRHALSGPTMGTRYSAAFFAASQVDRDALGRALQLAVDEVDEQMSTWMPGSDLMQFNAAPVGMWMTLPAELLTVVDAGLEIGRLSDGAFDIGMGDLVQAWGFGPHSTTPNASDVDRIARDARRPASELLERDVEGGRLRKLGQISIDLSGIAKGYGVDRLAETLDEFGVSSYLVSIDGELRARGRKPSGEPWRVAVERPRQGRRDVSGYVDLVDAALATSGNYRHVVSFRGETRSHTMDPRSARPAANDIGAVTIRADTCMLADVWATAVLVSGSERGLEMSRRHGFQMHVQAAEPLE